MTTTAPAINATSAIALASEQSAMHHDLAQRATTEAEKRAHLSTMRALNRAAMEMARGNMPQPLGDGVYLCESRTNAGVVYRVDVFAQRCDCANQHACWHLVASDVCEQITTREANDGDLLSQGVRDILADDRYIARDDQVLYAPRFGDESSNLTNFVGASRQVVVCTATPAPDNQQLAQDDLESESLDAFIEERVLASNRNYSCASSAGDDIPF